MYNISDSAFDELTAAIESSQLKQLNYGYHLTIEKAKSLARLLTQTTTLDEVSVRRCGVLLQHEFKCGDIDVVKILFDAMKHSRVNKPHLRGCEKFSQSFSNLEDRLTLGCKYNKSCVITIMHDKYNFKVCA